MLMPTPAAVHLVQGVVQSSGSL